MLGGEDRFGLGGGYHGGLRAGLIEEAGFPECDLVPGFEKAAVSGAAVDAQGVAPQVFDEVAAVFKRYLGLDPGYMGLGDDNIALLGAADQKAVPTRFKAAFWIVFLNQSESAVHLDTPRTRCHWEYLS